MSDPQDELALLRQAAYALLILVALGTLSGRVLSVRGPDGRTPFFSANDRSRWLTISALVDTGGYEVDTVRRRPGWQSIDMVRHTGRDGKLHYYSSKPPLWPTILAGQYYLLKQVCGLDFARDPFTVARVLLFVNNVIPWTAFLVLFAVWVERRAETDFGRIFLVAAACFGTLLTPFAVSLNNHLPAAISAGVCLMCVLEILRREQPSTAWFAIAGLSAAWAAANELPALSLLALVAATVLWRSPRQTLIAFLPLVLLIGGAFFLTTYLAHGSLRPPYAHRQLGDNWYDYPGSYWVGRQVGVDQGEPSIGRYALQVVVGHHGFFSLTPLWFLSVAGGVACLNRRDGAWRYLAGATGLLWLVCVVFYTALRPEVDRNYGGVASGFRWLFWLIPGCLLCTVPAADWLAESRRRQVGGLLLLLASVVSASIPAGNPWTHPWLYRCGIHFGWFKS